MQHPLEQYDKEVVCGEHEVVSTYKANGVGSPFKGHL